MFERPSALPAVSFAVLPAAYLEPERHYHNVGHVEAMLNGMGQCRPLLHDAEAVERAIWFHDVVYDARAGDNEERSAAFAGKLLRGTSNSGASPGSSALS